MNHHTDSLHGHMNDTKWDELRLAMYGLEENRPRWRTKDVENGYLSEWDGEWFYHFRLGGYETIEYVEIQVSHKEMRDRVRSALVKIHLPGRETEEGFIVYGYTRSGESVDYIKSS
jgi:hypothetical protein